jgi:hypothetical protein
MQVAECIAWVFVLCYALFCALHASVFSQLGRRRADGE